MGQDEYKMNKVETSDSFCHRWLHVFFDNMVPSHGSSLNNLGWVLK